MSNIYDFDCKNAQGDTVSLSDYKNKVLLIVNTASKCGFTPQYEGLNNLHLKYSDEDFSVHIQRHGSVSPSSRSRTVRLRKNLQYTEPVPSI